MLNKYDILFQRPQNIFDAVRGRHLLEMNLISYMEKDGKKYDYSKKRCKSFVRAFIWILMAQMKQSSTVTQTKDTADVLTTISGDTANFNASEGANLDVFGIQVGTGVTAVSIEDNKLANKIAHGSLANQLSYAANSFTNPSVTGNVAKFAVSRQFTNNSGGNITVNEVGLVCKGNLNNFLVERTLDTKIINNATSRTYTYEIKVTV